MLAMMQNSKLNMPTVYAISCQGSMELMLVVGEIIIDEISSICYD